MAEVKPYRRLNKFELHQLIGEGAMGVVWKAYDTELRRYVALKLLSTRIGKTREMRDRFLREARAAAGVYFVRVERAGDGARLAARVARVR